MQLLRAILAQPAALAATRMLMARKPGAMVLISGLMDGKNPTLGYPLLTDPY
jgi:uncharacterized membrane-anchored protein